MAAQPQCALVIGLEALHEQTIEAAPVRLDPQREITGERPLDAGDDLPGALALQPPAVGGGQLHVVVALKALVRRRLGLLGVAGPPDRRPDAARQAHPRLPQGFARERVPVEPHARLERHPRSERQPILRPPADLRPCQAGVDRPVRVLHHFTFGSRAEASRSRAVSAFMGSPRFRSGHPPLALQPMDLDTGIEQMIAAGT